MQPPILGSEYLATILYLYLLCNFYVFRFIHRSVQFETLEIMAIEITRKNLFYKQNNSCDTGAISNKIWCTGELGACEGCVE